MANKPTVRAEVTQRSGRPTACRKTAGARRPSIGRTCAHRGEFNTRTSREDSGIFVGFFMPVVVALWLLLAAMTPTTITSGVAVLVIWGVIARLLAARTRGAKHLDSRYGVLAYAPADDSEYLRDGYCYLALFKPTRRASLARLLGPTPYVRLVEAARPDYAPIEVSGGFTLHIDGARNRWISGAMTRERGCGHRVGLDVAAPLVCDTYEGAGMVECPRCGTVALVGDSGPHIGTQSERCVCGCVWAVADHTYAHDLIVHFRGVEWTAQRENAAQTTRSREDRSARATEHLIAGCTGDVPCEMVDSLRGDRRSTVRHRLTHATPSRSARYGDATLECGAGHPHHSQPTREVWYQPGYQAFATDYMWRPELTEGGLRNPNNKTLHDLDPVVFDSARNGTHNPELEAPALAHAWETAAALFEAAVADLPCEAFVVVTAYNTAQCQTTFHAPGALVNGATHGVVFCVGEEPRQTMAAGWRTIYVPLDPAHFRGLAGIRAVALTHGRSDIDVLIVNGNAHQPEVLGLVPRLREVGVAYASVSWDFAPVNFGCHFSFGSIYAPDREIIAKSFAAYGNVYGWDEAVVSVRSPVTMIVSPNPHGNYLKDFGWYDNVTVLENSEWGINAWHYPRFGANELVALARGQYASETLTPEPTTNWLWASVDGAKEQRDAECELHGIPAVQWGASARRLPRAGGRWSRVTNRRTDDPDFRGVDLPGAIWRAKDRGWGLRSRLAPSLTQGISPDVWGDIRRDAMSPDPTMVEIYETAARRMAKWEKTMPRGIIVVAAVFDREQANAFKAAYSNFATLWIFLSETECIAETGELWVSLPIVHGVGFNYQLARLLPGLYSRHERVFTVGNDLQTDLIPRDARLAVGLSALEYEDVVFPAMEINSPCPFQDVVYRGDAFAPRGDNLLDTLAEFGWLYGVDEVWCNLGDYPTVACTTNYGGASHPAKRNPHRARLWTLEPEGLTEWDCEGGAFRSRSSHSPVTPAARWWDVLRAVNTPTSPVTGFYEVERDAFLTWGAGMVNHATESGNDFAVWFTFGTLGDRVPILAAARAAHRLTGVPTMVVHLLSLAEGGVNLALCEQGKALNFLGDLFIAARNARRAKAWVILPDYLWTRPSQLAFSLRAHERDARNPKGGLPRAIDWLVQIVYWKDRARVRIGCYKGLKWFARSSDGHTFIKHVEPRIGLPERKVVVTGSSSVPIPSEYADWDVLPAGDHIELAADVTVAVTNGSVGTVSTLKSGCGVERIITYNDAIDRQWRQPHNAALGVDGNEPAEKYRWIYGWFRPSLVLTRWAVFTSPRATLRFLWWRLNIATMLNRVWVLVFVGYSLRHSHILPSAESSILAALKLVPQGWLKRSLVLLLAPRLIKAYADYCDASYMGLAWRATRELVTGIFQPTSGLLVGAGVHPIRAALVAALMSKLPDPFELSEGWTIRKRLSKDTVTGVWLFFTPVYVFKLPLGLHAGYYDASTGEVLEGAAVSRGENALGAPFAFRRTKVSGVTPWFAIKSALTTRDLESANDTPAPYSAVWNCQIMLASFYLQHNRSIVAAELVTLVFFSAYASVALAITAVCCVILGSSSIVALAAAGPIDKAFPQWRLRHRIERLNRVFARAITWFGAEAVEDHELRDAAACIAADAIKAGVQEEVVFECITDAVLASAYAVEDDPLPSEEICLGLLQARQGPSDSRKTQFAVVIDTALRSASRKLAVIGVSPRILEGIAAVAGNIIETAEAAGEETISLAVWLIDYLAIIGVGNHARALADAISTRLDRASSTRTDRRKNVWAILGKKNIELLKRPDWLALALQRSTPTVKRDDAISYIVNMLNESHPWGDSLETDDVYRVPSSLPRRPRAGEQEFAYPSLLHSVDTQIDPTQTDRIAKYLSLGGQVGLDGMWAATDEKREEVTSRYFSEPYATPMEAEALVDDVVELLYNSHTDAFDAPGVVAPEVVRTKLNLKGRTGVPFINKVKARKSLAQTGWMEAIIQATYKILDSGEYPPDVYTEFAKAMVLDADKMVTRGPRTIMATCMLTTFVNGVFELERRTRPIWAAHNTGLGAPLTADYLGRAFEEVSKRRQTFGADVTAFDAHIPPVIFEVLARLSELGARNASFPEVGAALRNKYVRLQSALIVDLPTGKVWPKNRGGATGQSATSWDNTWAMRAVMVMVWALATGKPVAEFYTHNTVHNTGDDNIWGTDDNVDPEKFAQVAREVLGLELRVESLGALGSLSYLSKVAVPGSAFAAEILRVRPTIPTFTAIHDRGRLLTRRGAVQSRFSGKPFRAYKRSLVERGIGQALLTWHQRDVYNMFAYEWMEDLRQYIGGRPHTLVYDVTRDRAGDIEAIKPRFAANVNPTAEMRAALAEATRGGLKWPSYQAVLEAAYKEKEAPRVISPFLVRTRKPSLDSVLRDWVARTRMAAHRVLPDALVKLSPSPQAAPFSQIFFTWGYPVEKHVWRKCVSENPEISLSEFASQVRLSPYSVATSTTHFWWFLELPGVREAVMAEDTRVLYGRMVAATLLYASLTTFIKYLRASPIGLLVEAFQVYTQDAPRWFSILNSMYWLENAESSPEISSLMPRDPYTTQKRVAIMGSLLVPDFMLRLLGLAHTGGLMGSIATIIARWRTWRVARDVDNANKTPHENRWLTYVTTLLEAGHAALGRGVTISAETSTGKSTELVSAMVASQPGRVWVAVHTRVLRDTYRNPWLPAHDVGLLSKGVSDSGSRVVILTYGHLLARTESGVGPQEGDIVILDEFHLLLPVQAIAYFRLRDTNPCYMVSATPDSTYSPAADYVKIPIPREFALPTPRRLDLDAMALFLELKHTEPDAAARVLFIVPSKKMVAAIIESLATMGEPARALTALQRVVAHSGHIVATSVADTGVNITPAPTALIDLGLIVNNDRGEVKLRATDPALDEQRTGRVGRQQKGIVYKAACAGTGEKNIPYPSHTETCRLGATRSLMLEALRIHDALSLVFESGLSPSRVDPYMSFDPSIERMLGERDTCVALSAWWLLSNQTLDVREADTAYDKIVIGGWTEDNESVASVLEAKYRSSWLVARPIIEPLLARRPYRVVINHVVVKPLSLRYIRSETRWV